MFISVAVEMSAEVIGLKSLFKTFLAESDGEKADEQPVDPPGDKEDQAAPSPHDVDMSDKFVDAGRRLVPGIRLLLNRSRRTT